MKYSLPGFHLLDVEQHGFVCSKKQEFHWSRVIYLIFHNNFPKRFEICRQAPTQSIRAKRLTLIYFVVCTTAMQHEVVLTLRENQWAQLNQNLCSKHGRL